MAGAGTGPASTGWRGLGATPLALLSPPVLLQHLPTGLPGPSHPSLPWAATPISALSLGNNRVQSLAEGPLRACHDPLHRQETEAHRPVVIGWGRRAKHRVWGPLSCLGLRIWGSRRALEPPELTSCPMGSTARLGLPAAHRHVRPQDSHLSLQGQLLSRDLRTQGGCQVLLLTQPCQSGLLAPPTAAQGPVPRWGLSEPSREPARRRPCRAAGRVRAPGRAWGRAEDTGHQAASWAGSLSPRTKGPCVAEWVFILEPELTQGCEAGRGPWHWPAW